MYSKICHLECRQLSVYYNKYDFLSVSFYVCITQFEVVLVFKDLIHEYRFVES